MARHCELSFQQKSLFQQGYQTYTPSELRQLQLGLRFTPTVCSLLTVVGLVYQLPYLLLVVSGLGIWAFFAPAAHPMDLIYNNLVRPFFNGVKLPPNPFQRRLACMAAGVMNIVAASFFLAGLPVAAWVTGGMLLALQAIVIFTHFCTLSWMYEGVMRMFGKWNKPVDDSIAQKLLANGAMLVDVRGRDEFAAGHVYSAVNIPLDELEQNLEKLKGCQVLVHCRSGARSQIATQKLKQMGISQVFDLGGFQRAKDLVEATKPGVANSAVAA